MRGLLLRLAPVLLMLGSVASSQGGGPTIVSAAPGGSANAIRNFTIRFSAPMVPLGEPRARGPFDIACPVAGVGRWTDQQGYDYEFSEPLPGGVRCTLTLRAGLKGLDGAPLLGPATRYVLDTSAPDVRAILPARYEGAIQQDQSFLIATNVPADRASVAREAYCAVDGIGEKLPVDLLPPDVPGKLIAGLPNNYQLRSFLEEAGLTLDKAKAPGGTRTLIALRCRRPLPPGRDMALIWPNAITGNGRAALETKRFDYRVIDEFTARFECSRTNPRAGCNPVEPAYVRFSAPVPRATAAAIRIRLADGAQLAPTGFDEGDGNRSSPTVQSAKFQISSDRKATTATVLLPAAVRDENGRPLANARRFPLAVRFDAAPPLAKFAAPFGILEAAEGGVLPLTVRAVEPKLAGKRIALSGKTLRLGQSDGEIAAWLRRLDDAEESEFVRENEDSDVWINRTRDTPLLGDQPGLRPTSVALPGKGKAFEVVGIPLGKPGFYVVEMASPLLGRALLGRNATRYVAAGALVTNMAVHFKWGQAGSLAWVTRLDSAEPVAGAAVQLSDSCTGKMLARGVTDGSGRLLIRSKLPQPQTYGSCQGDGHPLMVSARKDGDFSFVLTSWDKGLSPYDFDMPFEWEDRPLIFHTIFDRTLMRAGETVHMKHVLRRPIATGFAPMALKGTLRLAHRGSDTKYDIPIAVGRDGIALTDWTAPKGTPQGDYDLSLIVGEETIYASQSVRVDEYRLPTMRATVSGPKDALVRPKSVPVNLYVGYLAGGGAANLPVQVRASFDRTATSPKGWDGWTFGGDRLVEGVTPLDDDNRDMATPLPAVQLLALNLDRQGAGRSTIAIPASVRDGATMTVEMDYPDANGETLTASQRIALNPANIRLGIRTDGWMMKKDDLRLKLVALDLDGKPVRGRSVSVRLYSREIMSSRRRLVGGFYAYENNAKVTRLEPSCTVLTDVRGLASCKIDPGVSGEVYAVATVRDGAGNEARAVTSVWLAGDDWWFGGDNGDRMDVIPEQREYKSTDTARFQVRMPFRSATALVTVEREGVLSSFVTNLSGKDPVIEVPLQGYYAPDVYVSVLAVRGRVAGWRLWLAEFARKWHLPFFQELAAKPTALVDLAKPSFRMGVAKIDVGWDRHRLAVDVRTDKPQYHVRDRAQVAVTVTDPYGKPPRAAEIAFVAIDEALLALAPNESWKLLDAMMGQRALAVLTSTAQMQVVGKRHYGRKAVAAGGGGGDLSQVNREDFRPVLLWKGRVPLDARGVARVTVPLSDSLSSFRMVAVATAGAGSFGTGAATVRTQQDLSIYSGLAPLVRSGDRYGASFTLRNGSNRPMTVTARVTVNPSVAKGPPLKVTLPAGGAQSVTWWLNAPRGIDKLTWTIDARSADGRAGDRLTVGQSVVPAVPVDVWAATLLRVGPQSLIPLTPPAGALPGFGAVEVRLTDSLTPPLDGVRRYMRDYLYNCFEQRLSKAVAVEDVAAWNRLAADMPAYLDRDGLLRYFPEERMEGSIALTAYALSITAEMGFPLPEAERQRLLGALRAVVEGRLTRDTAWQADNRIEKLAALAALARNGAGDPALFGQIGMAPADMQSASLLDWVVALHRTPGSDPAAITAAEAELRRRIAYEGSRFDLIDNANAPWWMMSSGDETANRMVAVLAGRPGWQDDLPRLLVGAALRQQRGHWDTTTANAWGVVAARKFTALYPPAAISGTTRLGLLGVSRTASWPSSGPTLLRFPLPRAGAPLSLSHPGEAGPWAQVQVSAAVPLKQAFFAGYRVSREVSAIQQRTPNRLSRGDVLRVRLTVEAGAERNWVVLDDPIPAGATIVGDLGGQSATLAAQASGGEGIQPSYVERGQDAWRGYFEWVPRGRFTVEYAVRLNAAGRFRLPPTRVQAMYSPEIRAALPNRLVSVSPR
ncbi:alpha-2-macroglobulin family protein [Rhizorhabdus dicambivorans]|uniref:Alpha-2-macroglobulin n=1 Tax=Rhizorhabdus dicambivorans TaxID=1850238 RepID=A0A2A4FRK3_9SPHN|nr:MG2 domain-containing protein [Rhizorhabdus dicambivorans]ATE64628.1 alpha-2-macroglobulin [Rhizorhabdus dicambivorans]PCE40749.1 alpha-2-macroglobulin [Rhizorhabdus dicambivorans]